MASYDVSAFEAKKASLFKETESLPSLACRYWCLRGAAAAQIDGTFGRYHPAVYKAMWVDGRNLNVMKEIAAVLAAAGLDPAKVGARIQDQDVKDRLKATTEEAVARGVFGAPTCFVDNMMFFGNDRLPFVEMALKGELK